MPWHGILRLTMARRIAHANPGGRGCWTIEPVELKSNVLANAGTAEVLSASMVSASARNPLAQGWMR
jgi:hypothetical protein